MARHNQFKAILIALIICIIGFNFVKIGGEFFFNPFYILSFVFAITLIVKSINYVCPSCQKNQVIRSFLSYRLPKAECYFCNCNLEKEN